MKDIVIIGAGGFGREVQWLIERINAKELQWNIVGYIDDGKEKGTMVNDIPVVGNIEELVCMDREIYAACAIGAASVRKQVIDRIKNNPWIQYPVLIDPSAKMSHRIEVGKGSIICAGNILTVNIHIGDFVIINLDCTVGHDAVLEDYVTVYPSVNISGSTHVGTTTELGTGAAIIQGINIGSEVHLGAGAVAVKDIPDRCTAVGCPARRIH